MLLSDEHLRNGKGTVSDIPGPHARLGGEYVANAKVGILGYGVYIPWQRIQTEAIVRARERRRKDLVEFLDKVRNGLLLRYKSIASHFEDTITMATEAAENAIKMSGIDPAKIGTVVAGSESKPYAVGQVARHVASFVGVGEDVFTADVEGACNAGMQAVSFVESDIKAGKIEYGLAIGSDIAQAPRGDPLEYASGAGAGAFVLGKEGDLVATIEDIAPYSSLTMDFWRREEVPVPSHLGRTTVEAYIDHVTGAMAHLLRRHKDLRIRDFDHLTFHQPSGYMPLKACKSLLQPSSNPLSGDVMERLRLTEEDIERKVKPWLRVLDTGNTYAASTPIATASILDKSRPGDNILAVSYGSGAYANATWLKVQEAIKKKAGAVPTVEDYVNRRTEIRLQTYQDHLLERLRRMRKYFESYRLVGEIEPLGSEMLKVLLCDGCKRVYYPVRTRCLSYDCKVNPETRDMPKHARLKSFRQLSLKERWITNFDIIKEGQVVLVDCAMSDLRLGMPLEAAIRRLDYEGKDGLIIYGPAYRPMFRDRTVRLD